MVEHEHVGEQKKEEHGFVQIETDLCERIIAKINRLCILQAVLAAPSLAPKPLLGQALDWYLC